MPCGSKGASLCPRHERKRGGGGGDGSWRNTQKERGHVLLLPEVGNYQSGLQVRLQQSGTVSRMVSALFSFFLVPGHTMMTAAGPSDHPFPLLGGLPLWDGG